MISLTASMTGNIPQIVGILNAAFHFWADTESCASPCPPAGNGSILKQRGLHRLLHPRAADHGPRRARRLPCRGLGGVQAALPLGRPFFPGNPLHQNLTHRSGPRDTPSTAGGIPSVTQRPEASSTVRSNQRALEKWGTLGCNAGLGQKVSQFFHPRMWNKKWRQGRGSEPHPQQVDDPPSAPGPPSRLGGGSHRAHREAAGAAASSATPPPGAAPVPPPPNTPAPPVPGASPADREGRSRSPGPPRRCPRVSR